MKNNIKKVKNSFNSINELLVKKIEFLVILMDDETEFLQKMSKHCEAENDEKKI